MSSSAVFFFFFLSSLVTTAQEGQPKLLVLSYNSDTGNKRRNTLNISGRRLPSQSLGVSGGGADMGKEGGVLMAMSHVGSQKSDLLMSETCKENSLFVFPRLFPGCLVSNQRRSPLNS